jgi:hypothetical protein
MILFAKFFQKVPLTIFAWEFFKNCNSKMVKICHKQKITWEV